MRKPRVVFLDHVALLSGAELALLRLLPSLMKGPQSIEPYVLLGDDGPLVARLREEGIECEVIALNPRVGDLRKDTVGSRLPLRAVWGTAGYILRIARELRVFSRTWCTPTRSSRTCTAPWPHGSPACRTSGTPVTGSRPTTCPRPRCG